MNSNNKQQATKKQETNNKPHEHKIPKNITCMCLLDVSLAGMSAILPLYNSEITSLIWKIGTLISRLIPSSRQPRE